MSLQSSCRELSCSESSAAALWTARENAGDTKPKGSCWRPEEMGSFPVGVDQEMCRRVHTSQGLQKPGPGISKPSHSQHSVGLGLSVSLPPSHSTPEGINPQKTTEPWDQGLAWVGRDLKYHLVPTLGHEISTTALEIVLCLLAAALLSWPRAAARQSSQERLFLTAHGPELPDKHRKG